MDATTIENKNTYVQRVVYTLCQAGMIQALWGKPGQTVESLKRGPYVSSYSAPSPLTSSSRWLDHESPTEAPISNTAPPLIGGDRRAHPRTTRSMLLVLHSCARGFQSLHRA